MSTQVAGQQPLPPNVAAAPQAQQTVYIQVPANQSVVANFANKCCLGLGICQLTIGILLIIFGGVSIGMGTGLSFVGSPIWCGIFFIITGALGMVAGINKGKGMIVATLVCSIIAASIAGGCLFPVGVVSAILSHDSWYNNYYNYDTDGMVAVDSVISILALAECVLAIIHSVICCRAVCCGGQQQQSGMPIYYQVAGQPGMAMQATVAPGGQQGIVSGYPVAQAQPYNPQPYYPQAQGYMYNPQGQGYNPQAQGYTNPQAQVYNPQGQATYPTEQPVVDTK